MRIIYDIYIKSPEWREKRRDVFKKQWKSCRRCWWKTRLDVHHGSYEKIWSEPMKHLFVLCRSCHKQFHEEHGTKRNMMKNTISFIKQRITEWKIIHKIITPRAKNKRKLRKRVKAKKEKRKSYDVELLKTFWIVIPPVIWNQSISVKSANIVKFRKKIP